MCPPRVRSGLPLLVGSVAAALLVLGPTLGGGYLLRYDLVFVPRQPLTWGLLGLDSTTPRAVPSDLVLALASHLVPGRLVGPVVLVALLVLAAFGAGRVIPLGPWGSAAAGLAYVWTAYVGEHLLIGQWAVLIGYAALPWVIRAAARVARDGHGWPPLVGWLALGSLGGGATWVIVVPAALVTMVVASTSGRPVPRRVGALVAVVAVLALPWAVPALTRPGGVPSNVSAATVFAPSPDTRLGAVGSLLTGGGIWSADVVPAGRLTLVGSLGALAVLALAITGWWLTRSTLSATGRAVIATGVLGLVVALSGLVRPVADAVARVPGGGLLRDSSRALAPWCLLVAVGVGLAVPALAKRWRLGSAYALGLLPLAVLPALAWGVSGRLHPVDYPADYRAVARLVDGDPRPGAVLVLPFQAYRRLTWNHDQTSLSALPRWLDRTVVASSDLLVQVGGHPVVVPGEDRLGRRAGSALTGVDPAAALGRLGIRWVVTDVIPDAAGQGPPTPVLSGLSTTYAGPALRVQEVPEVDPAAARDPARADRPDRAPVLIGDLAWVVLVLGALLVWALRGRGGLLLFGNRQTARPDVSGASCESS